MFILIEKLHFKVKDNNVDEVQNMSMANTQLRMFALNSASKAVVTANR